MISLSRKLVAIDYDADHVRALEFSGIRGGPVKVFGARVEAVPKDVDVSDADVFGRFLSAMLERGGIKSRSTVFCVSRSDAIIHSVPVPSVPDDELANLVRFRLSQELPFAIEESVVDFVVTSRDKADLATSVDAVAVKLECLDRLRHIARVAGLQIRRIGLRPLANYRACRRAGYLKRGPALFVYVGGGAVEFDVFSEENGLLFSRSAGIGGEINGEDIIEEAMLQLQRTMPAYTAIARSEKIATVIVAGDSGFEDELLGRIKEELGVDGRVFELDCPGVGEKGHGLSACHGLAAGAYCPQREEINFVAPKRAVDPVAKRARRIQVGTLIAIAVVIVGLFISSRVRAASELRETELATTNKALSKQLKVLKGFEDQLIEIRKWRDGKVNWLAEINALTGSVLDTKDAYIVSAMLVEKDDNTLKINITGKAKSGEAVDVLYDSLRSGGRYHVDRGAVSPTKKADYQVSFKFELKAQISDLKEEAKPVDEEKVVDEEK